MVGVAPLGHPLELPQCLGFVSICDGELGVPLESQQGNWASSPVEVGNSGLISGFSRKSGFLLSCDGETWGSSRVVTGESDLSSGGEELGFPLELQQGSQASSQVVRGELRVPL